MATFACVGCGASFRTIEDKQAHSCPNDQPKQMTQSALKEWQDGKRGKK